MGAVSAPTRRDCPKLPAPVAKVLYSSILGKSMRHHTCKFTLLSLIVIAALVGCGKQESAREPYATASAPAAMAPAAAAPAAAEKSEADSASTNGPATFKAVSDTSVPKPQQLTSSANSYTDGERQFVRTADLDFTVKDVYQSALAIEDMAAASGGFVIKNEIHAELGRTLQRPSSAGKLLELTEYTQHGALVLRVPSAKTQSFLRTLASQIVFLNQRNFNAEDVELQLLRQQLAYRRQQETQQSLGNVAADGGRADRRADVIAAQGEAKANRDEAELAQREFADKVAFSTISLTLTQPAQVRQSEVVDVEAVLYQNRPSFGSRLAQSLSGGWNSLLDVAVGLAGAWPMWLLLAAGAGTVIYYRKRRTK